MLEVYEKTILQLKSVQSLHLQGCAEHPQGQGYRLAAALCYLTVRWFFSLMLELIQTVASGDGRKCWGTSRAFWIAAA